MRKSTPANENLINRLYDFGDQKPKLQYKIIWDRIFDQYATVEGLQTRDNHCFYFMPDMEEAVSQLNEEIEAWKELKRNHVKFKVHPVKRPKWGDFVLYVQIISPSYTPATKYVLASPVWERDYVALENFIADLSGMGPYPASTTISSSA